MPETLTPTPPTQPNPQKLGTPPPPRHVLNYLGRLGPAQRRFRSTLFSRENWINFLKSLPWVVPLTILIWVYAEREQLADDPKVPIPIEVRTNDPNRVATIVYPPDRNITAQLTGPRGNLDRVKQRILPVGDSRPVVITADLSPGTHELFTASQLQGNPIFKDAGVTVTNCSPAVLRIYIDQMEEREFTVRPSPGAASKLESVTFEPARVKVRGPAAVLDNMTDRAIFANFTGLESLLKNGGQQEEAPVVPLTSPFKEGDHVTISPKTVRAFNLKTKEADVDFTLDYVPIQNVAPQRLLEQWKVRFRPEAALTLANVRVRGPREQIDMLKDPRHEPKPVALLKLNPQDTDGNWHTGTLRIVDLPPGVEPVPEDSHRTIDYKLVEITAPE